MGNTSKRVFISLIKKNMNVIDVGANIGLYTGLFSRLVGPAGKVISIEPDPDNFAALLAAAEANRWANVELHACALHDKQGSLYLARDPCNSGNHVLSESPQMRVTANLKEVKGRRLDELVGCQKVDFIKIDVQGWELLVLKGAQNIIASGAPLQLLVELWPAGLRRSGNTPENLFKFLRDHGFSLFETRSGVPVTKTPQTGYKNVLAIRR